MIRRAAGEDDWRTIANLAMEIWHEHYQPLIGSDQVAYMLEKFQSPAAIARQGECEGYEYYILEKEGEAIGYLAFQHVDDALFLSKIYVLAELRGSGQGRAMLDFVEGECARRGLGSVWLTVNKGNELARQAYERAGYQREREVVQDIGGGFVMDDFVFRKLIKC